MDTGGSAADDDNDSGASLGRGVEEGDDEVEDEDVDLEEMREDMDLEDGEHARPFKLCCSSAFDSYMLLSPNVWRSQ
jgi:hypothetical protein